MKDLTRARRRQDEATKYLRRIKKFLEWTTEYTTKDGKTIINPTVDDVLRDHPNWVYTLKNESGACSCSMCTYKKFNRVKSKKNIRDRIKEQLNDNIEDYGGIDTDKPD